MSISRTFTQYTWYILLHSCPYGRKIGRGYWCEPCNVKATHIVILLHYVIAHKNITYGGLAGTFIATRMEGGVKKAPPSVLGGRVDNLPRIVGIHVASQHQEREMYQSHGYHNIGVTVFEGSSLQTKPYRCGSEYIEQSNYSIRAPCNMISHSSENAWSPGWPRWFTVGFFLQRLVIGRRWWHTMRRHKLWLSSWCSQQ